MSQAFSEDLKRRVREANNIVDIVQGAVGKLTRAGRNLKACCPFHNEKTPSFNVNVEGQYFHCFGCGKSGDIFTFVQLHERVSFPEALRILADRAGIRVESDPRAAEQYKKETDFKSWLYRLNDFAAKFYREQLFTDAGKEAREYLKKRGLSDECCEKFRIGFAPGNNSPLLSRLQANKVPAKALLASGLFSQRDDGSMRDFFFNRVMFPITNMDGRVIAFGGRVLGDGEPKYLNTRDTLLFSKTQTVYALDHAKEAIKECGTATIVEGYTDVMMCHQFGIANVVACLGTAITPEHIRQLRRVANDLLILTDSDAAGARASERSLTVLFSEEMPAKVARLPGADKDPCDFLLAHGKDAFIEGISKPVELFDYKFDIVCKKYDVRKPLELKQAVEELMQLISQIPNTLLKNRFRYEVQRRLNIDERDLRYEARATQRPGQNAPETDVEHRDLGTVPEPETPLAAAERALLHFLFHEPAWLEPAIGQVDLAALTGAPERLIGHAILGALGDGKLPPDAALIGDLGPASFVAREVMERLVGTADEGMLSADAARALCAAFAEKPTRGIKLDPGQQMDMLVRPIKRETLYIRYRESERRLTHAKLQGKAQDEEAAFQEMVTLRREIAKLKSAELEKTV